MRPFLVTLFFVSISVSQDARQTDSGQAYRLPFASQGNTIELTVANTSSLAGSQITVEATGAPSWLRFSEKTVGIDQLKPKEEKPAVFTFSVDKLAPVNKEQSVIFAVRSMSGERWTKEIKIQVAPPEKFELFQNFPNPFNPTTTICYQLTKDSKVNLKIYNVLGQEVATLVDELKQAGYHQEVFDASRYASGMYIYRIVYTNEGGKQASDRKTMMLVK